MTITTKTGDHGTTSVKDRRLSKADTLIVALGDLDECSSLIIHMQAQLKLDVSIWEPIVNELYHISAVLSGFSSSVDLKSAIQRFELAIQAKQFRTQKFIFPFNQEENAFYHYVRAVSRRAERSVVSLAEHQKIEDEILMYLNRLSDFIFSCEI